MPGHGSTRTYLDQALGQDEDVASMSIDDLLRLERLAAHRLTRRDLLRATGKGGAGFAAPRS